MLEQIKELRERTNISMAKCKSALEATGGNIDEAIVWLQKQGAIDSAKKAGREANEGMIYAYTHMGKLGVLAEINVETDFSARSEPFKTFVEQVALQVAAMDPKYVSRADVPEADVLLQKEIAIAQMGEGFMKKPEAVREKILDGKLSKWYSQICLLDQVSVTVENKTIEQLRTELVSKIGENVVIKRFVRWELGR